MAVTRTCDICQSRLGVERYSMQHKQRRGVNTAGDVVSTTVSLSMGGIDLCGTCWQSTAEPRMRQYLTDLTTCDICGSTEDTLRLTLKQSRRVNGEVKDRGRGSIVLCVADWERTGLEHMRSKPNGQQDPTRVFLLNARRHRP